MQHLRDNERKGEKARSKSARESKRARAGERESKGAKEKERPSIKLGKEESKSCSIFARIVHHSICPTFA